MLISIGQAALMIGVSLSTLRRWEEEGRFLPKLRTKGGHRRYDLAEIEQVFFGKKYPQRTRKTIAYARVSSADQKLDLKRQVATLQNYCKSKKYPFLLLFDLGSGLNCHKKGLNQLIELVCSGQVERLVLTQRDRLLRFGSPLIFKLCALHHTQVIILHEEKTRSFEEELSADVIELMTVFCARVYGHRAHQNRLRREKAS